MRNQCKTAIPMKRRWLATHSRTRTGSTKLRTICQDGWKYTPNLKSKRKHQPTAMGFTLYFTWYLPYTLLNLPTKQQRKPNPTNTSISNDAWWLFSGETSSHCSSLLFITTQQWSSSVVFVHCDPIYISAKKVNRKYFIFIEPRWRF